MEWTSEGKRKGNAEYVRRSRHSVINRQRMTVRAKWAQRAKPGGTAGAIFLSQQEVAMGWVFLFPSRS